MNASHPAPPVTPAQLASQKRNGPLTGAVEPTAKPKAGYEPQDTREPLAAQARGAVQPVAVYIDGFNLYYGMREKFGKKYYWLDLWKLSTALLKDDQHLVSVKYFSASVRNDPAASGRQQVYLNALRSVGVDVTLGRYQEKEVVCVACGAKHISYEEKESDVNFCLALQGDAHAGTFATAILLTGDSDMAPAARAVQKANSKLRLIAAFPPARFSEELRKACGLKIHLNETRLRQAQFPKIVNTSRGALARPATWQ